MDSNLSQSKVFESNILKNELTDKLLDFSSIKELLTLYTVCVFTTVSLESAIDCDKLFLFCIK